MTLGELVKVVKTDCIFLQVMESDGKIKKMSNELVKLNELASAQKELTVLSLSHAGCTFENETGQCSVIIYPYITAAKIVN